MHGAAQGKPRPHEDQGTQAKPHGDRQSKPEPGESREGARGARESQGDQREPGGPERARERQAARGKAMEEWEEPGTTQRRTTRGDQRSRPGVRGACKPRNERNPADRATARPEAYAEEDRRSRSRTGQRSFRRSARMQPQPATTAGEGGTVPDGHSPSTHGMTERLVGEPEGRVSRGRRRWTTTPLL